jgi:hypothetical protein
VRSAGIEYLRGRRALSLGSAGPPRRQRGVGRYVAWTKGGGSHRFFLRRIFRPDQASSRVRVSCISAKAPISRRLS